MKRDMGLTALRLKLNSTQRNVPFPDMVNELLVLFVIDGLLLLRLGLRIDR
jgi:hypothetical protein